MRLLLIVIALQLSFTDISVAGEDAASTFAELPLRYAVIPDVTYLKADNIDLKLDIYIPMENFRGRPEDRKIVPTVVYFHAGGWRSGDKFSESLQIMPYLYKGWAAVNVNYRLSDMALAPAAVEDARCAVWWVKRNALQYGFDSNRIVLTGVSAGGHLALITGMLPASTGLDARCPGKTADGDTVFPELKVAAIVNWSGITDVSDLIGGPHMKSYAVMWLGAGENRRTIARLVSPITYVRKNLPPILTLHGSKDTTVPYEQAVRLHKALDRVGAPNRLYTVQGRHHYVDYSPEDLRKAFAAVDGFLARHLPK